MLLTLVVATLLAKPSTPSLPLKDTVAPFLAAKPTPKFPDYTDNYQKTVVVPEKARQDALEAAERAKQTALVSATTQPPNTSQTGAYTVTAPLGAGIEPIQSGSNLDTNAAKLYIYMHESGNDPTRWNTSGCLGLGQACPASKLLAVCPTMDYGCEDAWFTQYAFSRYGGWVQAQQWWLRFSWW